MALLKTDRVDWKLDPVTWRLKIPLEPVAGTEGVRQRIGILLRMIRGEWFANLDVGMPWLEGNGVDRQTAILGQAFAEVRTRAEVRKLITSVDGVNKIELLTVTFDSRTRVLRIRWRVSTIWGDTVADEFERVLPA